jgi:hypothetical protein
MMELLWPRAVRRRSRIFEHALRQMACRAAALIFHEKCEPTLGEWAAGQHSCFRISLVNASALATIARIGVLVPIATFSQATKKQTKNSKAANPERETRNSKTGRSARVPVYGGMPGSAAE